MPKREIIVAYVPVLHRGYLQFFESFPKANEIYVISNDILSRLDYLRKDLRAMTPELQAKAISGLSLFDKVKVLNTEILKNLDNSDNLIILPDEDISREILNQIKKAKTKLYPIFLRWDRGSVESLNEESADEVISAEELAQKFMKRAMEIAGKSSDIWRKVGAVLVTKNGKEINSASNKGEPTEHSPWIEGDPRNIFNRGVGIEMSVFTHAEAGLIADAARNGIKLEGADIYVTTFPCPACAKLIAHSGIKTCYYKDGYAVLDGKRVLKDYGTKVIRVEMDSRELNESDDTSKVQYKSKKSS